MADKILTIKDKLLDMICEQMENPSSVNTEEMGMVVDMVKDLAEAEYNTQIVDAMNKAGYEMTLEKYKQYSPEYLRKSDAENGIMYYTENEHNELEQARVGYMESRSLDSLENYLNTLSNEISDMADGMDNSARTMVRTKLQTMLQHI